MKVVIPYKHFATDIELKYCLRGIEMYIDKPEVIIIGDCPKWVQNVTHIPFADNLDLKYKEKNIFNKLLLMEDDFLFFNDDHFLLKPFSFDYHFSGTIRECYNSYPDWNVFRNTVKNTLDEYGGIKNYYRHAPMFIKRQLLKELEQLPFNKPYGYCIKSIYCHLNNIEGTEYPDLKFRHPTTESEILRQITGRPYFSTDNGAVNNAMIKVLNEVYPVKSKYEA